MNIAELEKELTNKGIKNITNRKIADIWGMNEVSYSHKKRLGSEIKPRNIEQIENYFGITLLKNTVINEGIKLDYYPEISASCGNGSYTDNTTLEKITVPMQAIEDFNIKNQYTVIRAFSDSMQPEILPQDYLVVQHNINGIIDNHIYIFTYQEKLYCKYLSNNLGQIIVRSENERYPIRYIEGEELNNFYLIGEVKAHIRKYVL